MKKLYFGDNLDVLQQSIPDETIDLVYLDPPFNSDATYNVLFKAQGGEPSEAQVEVFRDTWGWGDGARNSYDDVMRAGGELALVLSGLRQWLGENAMMAYLAMMANRMLQLRRVMKPTASLYLHCDPTAGHYLKIILDAIFRHENFLNEIVWKRTYAHGSSKRYGPVHDLILFYGKSQNFVWNNFLVPHDGAYVEKHFRMTDETGRLFEAITLTGAGVRRGESGEPWRNVNPTTSGRHWALPKHILDKIGMSSGTVQERLDALDAAGLIYWPTKEDGKPRLKWYADELVGVAMNDVWTDIPPISATAQERLGYPTQKPRALLERIISASCKPGDVVLDPFCGCGTTVEAAEHLGRQWVGIDVTHYAVTLIERRLRSSHPNAEYKVEGRPADLDGARELFRRDPHQFQWWASWRLGAQSYREEKRGADRGIDGNIFFANGPYGTGRIIISVKGGEHIGPQFVRELRGTIERENAAMGILITLAEPTRAMIADAAAAGFIVKSAHGRLPRIQIATIADILDGRPPKMPPIPEPQRSSAPRRGANRRQLEILLPFPGQEMPRQKGDFVDPRFFDLPKAAD